jgi:hypothetical protein
MQAEGLLQILKRPPLNLILSQRNSFHILTQYYCKAEFNKMLPSTPNSSSQVVPVYRLHYPMRYSSVPLMLYAPPIKPT